MSRGLYNPAMFCADAQEQIRITAPNTLPGGITVRPVQGQT
jgi:hypothetical protein